MYKNIVLLVFFALVALGGCASTGRVLDYSSGNDAFAIVEIPEYLDPLSLNGQKIKTPFLVSYPYEIKIPSGLQTLEFRYKQEWGGRDSKEYKESEILQVQFDAVSNDHYRLSFNPPESALSLEKADLYLSEFTASLVSASGNEIKATTSGEKEEGFKISLHGNALKDDSKMSDATNTSEEIESSRLDTLKELWRTTSDSERSAFMNWVISPDTR